MCTKGSALHLQLGSMTERMFCSRVLGLAVPCLCACCVCVVKVPMADWGHKAANASSSHHIFFHSASALQPASLVLPLHVDIPCVCSTSLLCPAFLAVSFFSWGSTEVCQDKWQLPTLCCMSSVLVILPFWQSRLGRWGAIEVSLPISVYQVWHNEQSELRYFWLTVFQRAMHGAIYLALLLPTEINKIHTMLLACQEAILCINLSFGRQAMWQRRLILTTDNTSCL